MEPDGVIVWIVCPYIRSWIIVYHRWTIIVTAPEMGADTHPCSASVKMPAYAYTPLG
jgi:hypothetical protein